MQDIHDILPLIGPPDYTNLIIIFLFFGGIIFLFILKQFFSKSEKILKEEKNFFYSKEKFLGDLVKIKNFIEKKDFKDNKFDKKYWLELSKILKIFISENHDEKIFFLSFGEIKRRKKIKHLEKIFKKFDEQFYFYEKKGKNEFLELILEMESEFK